MKNYLNESLSAQERAEALVNEMTVEEALEFFRDLPKLEAKLRTLSEVGLGYILPITGGMRVSMGLHEAVLPPCFHRQ